MTKSIHLSWQMSAAILLINASVLILTAYTFFDTNDCLVWTLSFFGLFQIYGIFRYLVQSNDEVEWSRRRAWILTLFAALSLVVTSFFFLASRNVISNLMVSPDPVADILYLTYLSPLEGRMAAVFFSAHCFIDLLVGTFDYPEHVGILPGYVHHTSFIIFLPLTLYSQIEGGFLLLCINEIPTAILALGQIVRPLRQDLLFGILFFLIRVLFTIAYTLIIVVRDDSSGKPFLLFITLPICLLHLLWFRDWVRGYSRRKQKQGVVVVSKDDSKKTTTNDLKRVSGGAGAMPSEREKDE